MFENETEETQYYLTTPVVDLTNEEKETARILGRIALESRGNIIENGESIFSNIGDKYTIAKLENFTIALYTAAINGDITGKFGEIITNAFNGSMDFQNHVATRNKIREEMQKIYEREQEINTYV